MSGKIDRTEFAKYGEASQKLCLLMKYTGPDQRAKIKLTDGSEILGWADCWTTGNWKDNDDVEAVRFITEDGEETLVGQEIEDFQLIP